jgi:hypothetical protein
MFLLSTRKSLETASSINRSTLKQGRLMPCVDCVLHGKIRLDPSRSDFQKQQSPKRLFRQNRCS